MRRMHRLRPARQWLVAAVVAASLVLPGAAQAAGTLRTQTAQLERADATRYTAGKQAWDRQDFAAAAKTFEALLGRVAESPANRTIRASLVLDTMAAYRAAYERGGDVAMLRAGMNAYYGYFKTYRDTHASTNIPEAVVEARFVMKEALAHAESGGRRKAAGSGPAQPAATEPAAAEPTAAEPAAAEPARGAGSSGRGAFSTDDPRPPGTTLIATGAVLVALGVGATAMIGVGAVNGKRARADQKLPGYTPEQRDRIDRRGRMMNTLLIAGAVTAPVLAVAGITLVAVGVAKKKRASGLAFAPEITGRYAGITVRGRF